MFEAPLHQPVSRGTVPLAGGARIDAAEAGRPPVFGFLVHGGALGGALISHVRLANELVRRGYPVHVWWAIDRARQVSFHPSITQRWLFNALRYGGWGDISPTSELVGRGLSRLIPDSIRQPLLQQLPSFADRQVAALVRQVCNGTARDTRLIRRFAREMGQLGVTHVFPTVECLGLFVAAARPYMPHPVRYLVTFQGYEFVATYAQQIGHEALLYKRLAEAVAASDWPAVAFSEAYASRIESEIGISAGTLKLIPPGVPVGKPIDLSDARALVRRRFPDYKADAPLVTFVGRRDAEKGLDLLLYAARILKSRGTDVQLAICGPTMFGNQYAEACRQIAWHLRLPVLWSDYVEDELREALFRLSRTVVYPSIHHEPFGMVPVEAMVQETPVVVPDTGGVAGVIRVGVEEAGLNFRSWDSGDLALQIERLVHDAALYGRLSAAAPQVAEYFSVERHGERILEHIGLPAWCAQPGDPEAPKAATSLRPAA